MIEKERVAIFIDGSNLFHKLKDLKVPNTLNFDYKGLCIKLARGREIISCRYYVGVIRAKDNDFKGQSLRASQLKLFNNLTAQGFVIKKGDFLFSNGNYHEKGVDVKMAVDFLVGAYDDIWDTAIIISSDSDLNPAIRKVKHLGKSVEYIGFSHNPCFSLQKYSTLSRLLIIDDLSDCIVEKV